MANIIGGASVLAFEVCIQHGNHNNATKFELSVLKAKVALWEVQRKFCVAVMAIDTSSCDKKGRNNG